MDRVEVMSSTCAAYVDDHWRELQQQRELAWDLDAISDRGEALAFLRRFENCLCIYSAYAQKLYSSYSFVIPQTDHGDITILPDEQAWHATYNEIPSLAVEPTGVYILPGETLGYSGLYLKVPSENRLVGSQELPFHKGLKLLIQRFQARGEAFLPVLIKEELRGFEGRMPSLHLHRVVPARLGACAHRDIEALQGTIAERLLGLFRRV
jgi:hypothetical protein